MKKSLKLNDSINGKLYLDIDNGSKIEKNIEKNLSSVNKTLQNIGSILNKAVYKKLIKGENVKKTVDLAKKTSSLSDTSSKLCNSLNNKYNNDIKDYNIGELDKRIKNLEKKLSLILEDK